MYRNHLNRLNRLNYDSSLREQRVIYTYIAGMKYYNCSYLKDGPIELEWEPDNLHDKNAIKVIQSGIHVGYIPRNITSLIRHGDIGYVYFNIDCLWRESFVARTPNVQISISDCAGEHYLVIESPQFILPKLLSDLEIECIKF